MSNTKLSNTTFIDIEVAVYCTLAVHGHDKLAGPGVTSGDAVSECARAIQNITDLSLQSRDVVHVSRSIERAGLDAGVMHNYAYDQLQFDEHDGRHERARLLPALPRPGYHPDGRHVRTCARHVVPTGPWNYDCYKLSNFRADVIKIYTCSVWFLIYN